MYIYTYINMHRTLCVHVAYITPEGTLAAFEMCLDTRYLESSSVCGGTSVLSCESNLQQRLQGLPPTFMVILSGWGQCFYNRGVAFMCLVGGFCDQHLSIGTYR